MLKKLYGSLSRGLLFVVAISVLGGAAYAGLNRIVGNNFHDGEGLEFRGTQGGKDSLRVLYGYYLTLDGDSLEIDTTNLKNVFAATVHTHDSTGIVNDGIGTEDYAPGSIFAEAVAANTLDSTKMVNGSVGTTTLKDGGVFDVDVAANTLDSTKMVNGSVGTTTLKDGGVYGVDIAAGQVVKYVRKSGGADTPVYDSALFEGGTNVTITQTGNTLSFAATTSPTYQDRWGTPNLTVDWSASNTVEVIYPVSEKLTGSSFTHRHFVRIVNNSGTDDQSVKVNASTYLPASFTNDCDSVTFGFRTTTIDTLDAKINLRIYAEKTTAAYWPPADTSKYGPVVSLASAVAKTWERKNLAAADVGPIGAGSWLAYEFTCSVDATNDTIDIEFPFFAGDRK